MGAALSINPDAAAERISFRRIVRAEVEAINQRRAELGRPPLRIEDVSIDAGETLDAVGLALSGGGVRSAAFSLGVLQALNQENVLRNVDYLSTVSGGGYMGSALSATMTKTKGEFVFGNAPKNGSAQAAGEIRDTPAVGHLRNYSNYLIPTGARDILTGAAIALRGLTANLGLVLPIILLFACTTIMTNPDRESLGCPDVFGYELCGLGIFVGNFGFTLIAAITGLVLFFFWALYRSFLSSGKDSEFRTMLPTIAAGYLVFVAVAFFIELQTFFIAGMFDIADLVKERQGRSFQFLTDTVKTLAAITAPIAAVVTFFRSQLGDILKAANTSARLSTRVLAILSKAAFWVAGLAVPLLIWVSYLYLSYWGIINTGPETVRLGHNFRTMFSSLQGVDGPPPVESIKARDVPLYEGKDTCVLPITTAEADADPKGAHTPRWLIHSATWLTYSAFCPTVGPVVSSIGVGTWLFGRALERPMTLFYFLSAVVLFGLAMFLRPNANSLHRLYRDRLSKAFLFDPRGPADGAVGRNEPSLDQGRDFPQLDTMKISELSTRHAPYHLINAALNIQGSDYANRRGRNADFFLMSPLFIGSEATHWASMPAFERAAPGLDLATAVAISGAAASSNMGANSIRPLRVTLALLNIRLGYWLKNPRYIGERRGLLQKIKDSAKHPLFLFNEMTGRLYENSDDVYLTDGGHIENLGIYQLLRRRCKIIIAVDAEADFSMRFPALVTLQRYARIDLGIRIEMPLERIHKTTCAWMGGQVGTAKDQLPPTKGPHAALGRIEYGGGQCGYLLYLKSSLTGDENDYVRDYARRYERFPHETTGDQFFSEEQFEVYRALGFHVAHRALAAQDGVQVVDAAEPLTLDDPGNKTDEASKAIRAIRAALLT